MSVNDYDNSEANPNQYRIDIAKSLFGVIPDDIILEEARNERLAEYLTDIQGAEGAGI